jgi:hypothetical protein
MVRNGECLRPYTLSEAEKERWAEGVFLPSYISTGDSIMTVVRSFPGKMSLQLVNFTDLGPHLRWDEDHPAPTPCVNVSVSIQRSQSPTRIIWDSPEQNKCHLLDFEYSNGTLMFQIPQINYTGLVVIYD